MQNHGARRAKKAIACLLYITERQTFEIEAILLKFGGAFNASCEIRRVSSRVCDVLPTIMQIAQLLYPELNFDDRRERLILRLDIGLPSKAIELAKYLKHKLSRADYINLIKANLIDIKQLENCPDINILDCLNNDTEKLKHIRDALNKHVHIKILENADNFILEPYES